MSIYRKTVWLVKGMREYTKTGYLAAAKDFKAEDLEVDLSNRAFMITGANSGIGKQTALEIAKRGGIVHLVCRNAASADEARNEIVEATSNQNVHVHILDMSNMKAIHQFADKFISDTGVLHVLINNAGCMINTRELTDEGNEKNFATNTLGTHILTTKLIPILKKSGNARVIIVSSGGMLTQKLNLDDLQFEKMSKFDGTMAYAQNKRQQVIMTEQYAKQFPDIYFASMHPGWADTPAVRTSMPDFYNKMKDKLRTVEQGADTLVWLAVSKPSVENKKNGGGQFFQDREPVPKHLPLAWSQSSEAEDTKLMTILNELADKFKPKE